MIAKYELLDAVLGIDWWKQPGGYQLLAELSDAVRKELRYDRRPILCIEPAGGSELGRCYNAHHYRVTSNSELKPEKFKALREAGVLGYGQEYTVSAVEKRMLTYVPDGTDWRGKPYTEVNMPLFVYTVTDLVDSSD